MRLAATYMGEGMLRISDVNPDWSLPRGSAVMLDVHPPGNRNVGHHRKFWAMLRYFKDFLPEPMADDSFKQWAVVGAGWFDIAPDGTLLARSIAFDKMPQGEFERLYSDALDYLLRAVGPENMTVEDVENAIAFA